MSGPRPQPTYLKLLRGNPGKRRLNKNEPQPSIPARCPEPPAFLSAYAQEEWKRVAPEAFALRLLSNLDRACFSAYAESYARWRTAEEALALMASNDPVMSGLIVKGKRGTAIENPLVYIARVAARTWSAMRPSSASPRPPEAGSMVEWTSARGRRASSGIC